MSNYDLSKLEKAADMLHIELTDTMKLQFIRFYEMIIEKNEVMNLTAITEYDEVILKHYIDSISIASVIDMNGIDSIIDVGTGAGFPGVPLKIIYPEKKVLLLDSLLKRTTFLDEVISEIGLKNISTIHGRSEDIACNERYREQYDLCVSRAVANMNTLAEYCIPFVKVGGYFVAYKSETSEEEIVHAQNAVKTLGCGRVGIERRTLPTSDIERTFSVTRKNSSTSKKYPRKAGIPQKTPLY